MFYWKLGNTYINNKGAIAIAMQLEKNQGLFILNLEENQIDFAGAKAFACAIEKNQTLKVLNLSM